MDNPTLDVLIITYNRAELFEKTLISVCNQTYQDFTIKIFNNGSTDNTKEVYEKIKAQYPNRRFEYMKLEENHQDQYFVDKKNEFITAEYVIAFHDDDLMHPQYVEYLMKVINENPNAVLLGGKTKISYNPEKLQWCEPQGDYIIGDTRDMAKWYFRGDTFSFPAICYKSECYKAERFDNKLYGNRGDFPFLMDIADHGLVCELQDRFLHYRLHEKQNGNKLPTIEQRVNLVQKIANLLLTGDEECKKIFYNRIYYMCQRTGFINYDIARDNKWISKETQKQFNKDFSHKYISLKLWFYKLMTFFVYKFDFLNNKKLRKKYTKSHFKYSKKYKKISIL